MNATSETPRLDEDEARFITRMAGRLKREEPEWGHLPAALRFKQAVAGRLGIEKSFEACRTILKVPGIDRLEPRRVQSACDAARGLGTNFNQLWPGGRTIVHPEINVVGESNHSEFSFTGRSAYLACFEDVDLRGRSAIISVGGQAVVDFEGAERENFIDNPEYDPGILYAAHDTYWMMYPASRPAMIDEAFMLSGSHTVDFGHWMIEYLPKLALALLAGLPPVPILIDRHIPRTMLGALGFLLPEGSRTMVIPHLAPVSVRRLWYASNPLYKGFYPLKWDKNVFAGMGTDAAHFAILMGELKRRLPSTVHEPNGWDRVFLARKPSHTKKKLCNHAAIEAAAAARGFHIIYPEDFDFLQQLRIIANARFIIAPEGSNSYLAFFARPGTQLCTLSPPYTFPLADISAILAAVGVDNTILTGPYMSHDADFTFWSDYRVDTEFFCDHVDRMLRQG